MQTVKYHVGSHSSSFTVAGAVMLIEKKRQMTVIWNGNIRQGQQMSGV